MKPTKASSAEDYKLLSSFEEIRKVLLQSKYKDRLHRPLAYWALPTDRRLPLAFLGRSLKDLLDTRFEELSATAGIGQKKIGSLVKLLHRAAADAPPAAPFGLRDLSDSEVEQLDGPVRDGQFDPTLVSEALWNQWRETVSRHGLANEKLGRLAPALTALPTVIWHTPLSYYLHRTVAEIRELKTHGEKRVRVVLEVFYTVDRMLFGAQVSDQLQIALRPRFIGPLEAWLSETLAAEQLPGEPQLREHLANPLLAQLKLDAGDTVAMLAEGRLGVNKGRQSVRMQSRKMGVTRARVYQLLDDCNKVFDVRWPEGRRLLAELAARYASEQPESDARRLASALRELCYPEKFDPLLEFDEPAAAAAH